MNIVLIGYRGTGKSAISRVLSKKLKLEVIHIDDLITQKAGISILEIVSKFGWEKFRELESDIIFEISQKDKCIIDTGGGVILKDENVVNLKKNGVVILLKANIETIVKRIEKGKDRPSLTGEKTFIEEIQEVLSQREEKYNKAADFVIDTSNLSIEEIVNEIIFNIKI
ncbi:MAG: shikimate kinase [bacterium]